MSSLRVIAGKARGFHLRSVPGDSTRPITDRVKEALFNIIGADIAGASILDMFGGTGCVGIEALSRGATYSRFIDINRQAIQTIKANLQHTGLEKGAEVIHWDALTYLVNPADRRFDYIYIAPPQYKEIWLKALKLVDEHPAWLGEDAWVIVQIHPTEYQSGEYQHLRQFDERRYGSTLLVFFETAQ